MTIQSILLGFLVPTLIGAGFHLWRGGSLWRLILYILFAWAGFWGGHLLGQQMGWTFLAIGSLNFGSAIILCILVLAVGYWLSLAQVETKKSLK